MESSWEASILGTASQYLEIDLAPGCRVQADAGAMLYCESGIPIKVSTKGGILGGVQRVFGGGATFILQDFENKTSRNRKVALSAAHGGAIEAVKLSDIKGSLILLGNAFLAGIGDLEFSIYRVKGFGGIFNSKGPIMQRITGSGTVWIQATGNMINRPVAQNATVVVSADALVAFDSEMEYDVKFQGVASVLVNQQVFLGEITGPGSVWLQTSSADRIAALLPPPVTPANSESRLGF